ncbi:flavodoxin family protein [Ramlibacter sp.]|uniref:flavodoxin family protein n=1 Tax=Ramlibacter sp. TaxID=1917967 RepID=UPI002FCBD00C
MDSILVVCYSHTGVSRRAAELLSSHHGWPLGEVTEVGARGTWRCVLDSLLRRRPEIRYQGPDPADFRTIVLVAPVWMYRLAGPMRSFVARERDAMRRVAVVSTMNSGGASNAVAEVARMLAGGVVIDAAAFTAREIEDGSGTARLLAFGDALQPGSRTSPPARQPAWTAPAS